MLSCQVLYEVSYPRMTYLEVNPAKFLKTFCDLMQPFGIRFYRKSLKKKIGSTNLQLVKLLMQSNNHDIIIAERAVPRQPICTIFTQKVSALRDCEYEGRGKRFRCCDREREREGGSEGGRFSVL